jgi:hypothetical protein
MYILGKCEEAPVYETVAIKLFTKVCLFDAPERVAQVLASCVDAPFFEGLASFPSYSCFPIQGAQKKGQLDGSSWQRLLADIEARRVRSVDLQTPQEDRQVRFDEIFFGFDARMPPLNDGINRLHLFLDGARIQNVDVPALVDFFCRRVVDFDACYGFANVHFDSADASCLRQLYDETIQVRPIDYINATRYEWDCDRVIKDVCWLNYLTDTHLGLAGVSAEALRGFPFYRRVGKGVVFALSGDPCLRSFDVSQLASLRASLEPVISEHLSPRAP